MNKAHLIGDDNLVWLPNDRGTGLGIECDASGQWSSDGLFYADLEDVLENISPYQVGSIVKIDCKECGGLGFFQDTHGESQSPCPLCGGKYRWHKGGKKLGSGQQSYKILGPIELKRKTDFVGWAILCRPRRRIKGGKKLGSGQQSYKILGPIELKRKTDFVSDLILLENSSILFALENKDWLCKSKAERIDK